MPSRASTAPSRWAGRQALGGREYTEAEARRVVAALTTHCAGRENALTTDDFVTAYCGGLGARTVRAILSDRDGIDLLVAYDGGLVFAVETADEAEQTTRRLEAKARTELRRVARRRAFAAQLPRVQGVLALDA